MALNEQLQQARTITLMQCVRCELVVVTNESYVSTLYSKNCIGFLNGKKKEIKKKSHFLMGARVNLCVCVVIVTNDSSDVDCAV